MLLQEIADVDNPGYIYGYNEASKCLDNDKQVSNRTKNMEIIDNFTI